MNKAQEFLNSINEKSLSDAEVKKALSSLTKLSKLTSQVGKEIDVLKKIGGNGGNTKAADFVLGELEDALAEIEMMLNEQGVLGEGMETAFSSMDKVWKSHRARKGIVDYAGEKDAEIFWSVFQDIIANDEYKNLSDLMKKAQKEFDKHAADETTD